MNKDEHSGMLFVCDDTSYESILRDYESEDQREAKDDRVLISMENIEGNDFPMCHAVNQQSNSDVYEPFQFAIEHIGNLRNRSFDEFIHQVIPRIIGKVLPFMRFSHTRFDDLCATSPKVHIFCTLNRSNVCVVSIPRPQKNGEFKINFSKKNLHLEENVANNVPISVSPHHVLIRVKRRYSTRLDQCWDIRWCPEVMGWRIKCLFGEKVVYEEPDKVPIDEVLVWVPTELRRESWCDLLRRVKNGEMVEERDSLAQKRVLLPHALMETLVIRQFRHIARHFEQSGKFRKADLVKYAFSTGNWGYGKVGVVTTLTSHNKLSELSDLRKVKVAMSRAGVVSVKTRHLLSSHYGFYCCVETTEGQTCGLIRQLAATATVSNHMQWKAALKLIEPGVQRVYINGLFAGIGSVSDSREHCRHVCVFEEHGGIQIRCDGGRLIRPVRICGKVRFVDSAMQRVVKYEEIFRAPSLGLIASMLPYLHHNQSPRSMYVIQMLKQGVMVNSKHKLWYPQKPVVAKCCDGFFVQNVVIAVLCTTGHNQEDSLIISSRAFDFGMFRHDHFVWNSISQPKKKHNNTQDDGNHDIDGLPFVNSDISPGDLVFANGCRNTGPISRNVIRVELSGAGARARTREVRVPQQGDKFCSLHGQKGICGRVERPENLPYTRAGITPDLIINPHAFPSRMTIGQILEVITGKAKMFSNTIDPIAFTKMSLNSSTQIEKGLEKAGFGKSGKEQMWDGISGLPLEHPVFIGVASYMRLKHLVDDKIYARGTVGPIDPLTSQPVSGRASGGGLRLGEMEKDCLLAHGALGVLQEKLITHSDPDSMRRCSKCSTLDGMCSCSIDLQLNIPMCSATKLLVRELAALNIKLRYTIKETNIT